MFIRYGAQRHRRQANVLAGLARGHWLRKNLLRLWSFGFRPGNNTPFRLDTPVPALATGFSILGNVGRVVTPDGWGQDTGSGNANASGWSTTDDGYRTSITTRLTAFTLLRMTASTASDFVFGNTDVRGGGGGVYNWGLYWGNSTSAFSCYVKNTSNTVVSASSPVSQNFNQTYLVALTYNGTTVTLYVDGVAVASNAQSGNVQTTDLDTTWAEWANQAGATIRQTVYYSGIANRVWTPEEIEDLNEHRWAWQERQSGHRIISLSTTVDLAIADALHAHAADNLALTQAHVLAVADAAHAHAADNLTLTTETALAIAAALHAHAADSVTLTQAHVLAIQDALHAHAADQITLSVGGTDLVIADALHAHDVDHLALTQTHVLVVSDALHAHLADVLSLSIPGALVTDSDRVLVVRGEGRTLVILRESRVLTVPLEARSLRVH